MHSYDLRDRTRMTARRAQIYEFPDYDVMGELKMRICEHLDRSEQVIAEKQTVGDTREEACASGKPLGDQSSVSVFGENGAPSYAFGEELIDFESGGDEPAGQKPLNYRNVEMEDATEVQNQVKLIDVVL